MPKQSVLWPGMPLPRHLILLRCTWAYLQDTTDNQRRNRDRTDILGLSHGLAAFPRVGPNRQHRWRRPPQSFVVAGSGRNVHYHRKKGSDKAAILSRLEAVNEMLRLTLESARNKTPFQPLGIRGSLGRKWKGVGIAMDD
jgi:hypothetical protein